MSPTGRRGCMAGQSALPPTFLRKRHFDAQRFCQDILRPPLIPLCTRSPLLSVVHKSLLSQHNTSPVFFFVFFNSLPFESANPLPDFEFAFLLSLSVTFSWCLLMWQIRRWRRPLFKKKKKNWTNVKESDGKREIWDTFIYFFLSGTSWKKVYSC